MAEPLRKLLDQHLHALKTERDASWLTTWQDLNRYSMPRVGKFLTTDRNKGDRRNQKILNEAVTFAVDTGVRGLMYGITNPAKPWIELLTPYPELNRRRNVKIYLEMLRDRMLEVFRRSNLYTVLPAIYRDLFIYGTNTTALNRDSKTIIRLEPFPVGSYALATSGTQNVDVLFREFQRTYRQMIGRFGVENCSDPIQQAQRDGTNLETWTDVRHGVTPNPNYNPDSPLAIHKMFRSCYWEPGQSEDKPILSHGGANTFPILCPRWDTQDGDAYGNSPLMNVFGTAKGIQKVESQRLLTQEKLNNPPLQAPETLKGEPLSQLPGSVSWLRAGTERITTLFQVDANAITASNELAKEYKDRINQAMFVDIFLLLTGDRRNMTAEEVRARVAEKVQTIGPVMLRLNDELLDPLVERTFEIMLSPEFEGLVPEAPEELQDVSLNIEYISDVHKAMKSEGVVAVERTVAFVTSLASLQASLNLAPTALDKLNIDETIDIHTDLTGTSTRVVNDNDAAAAIREARNAKMEREKKIEETMQAAQVAKDLGSTEAKPDSLLAGVSRG